MNKQILLDYILENGKRLNPKGVFACVLKGSGLNRKQVLDVVKKCQTLGFKCSILHIENDYMILEAAE